MRFTASAYSFVPSLSLRTFLKRVAGSASYAAVSVPLTYLAPPRPA
jgi:hypothetical protein